eukprot:TRINITY_DN14488_c0_g1_i1.p1 TRINITY_DN14488_c0_g1~~TRINITY_DN14488_c0_g1_i1.p1  ORF type:complete len:128 (+),score=24.21 TRINITY_DN14488_c0_g1_i1:126-509(+)
MRRVERLILGSPIVLRTMTSLRLIGRQESKIPRDWMTRFAPGLRYGNPSLMCEMTTLRPLHVEDVATKEEPITAEDTAQEASDTKERIEIVFSDGSAHTLNLALYRSSHHVMQRIIELDMEKGMAPV